MINIIANQNVVVTASPSRKCDHIIVLTGIKLKNKKPGWSVNAARRTFRKAA